MYDIIKGYTKIDNFYYTALTFPYNVHDALILKCEGRSVCESPQYDIPFHAEKEYIQIINEKNLEKAVIILDDFHFLPQCRSLKYLHIIPSYQAPGNVDFSPLYQLPDLISLCCQSRYGVLNQYISEVDYLRMPGLIDLSLCVTGGEKNYNYLEALKSLGISNYKSKSGNLQNLFCSKILDDLSMIQCKVCSLDGIETTSMLQCAEFSYDRSLADISALRYVNNTLKSLSIEHCPAIKDFSVLETLEHLEYLELLGNNTLPSLNFLKKLKHLKTFVFDMNVIDGDLDPCLGIQHVCSLRNRKHYNLKDVQLPKGGFVRGNQGIDMWRRRN